MPLPDELEASAPPASWRPAPLAVGILVVLVVLTLAAIGMRSGRSSAETGGSPGSTYPTTSAPAAWQTQFLDCVAERESRTDPTAVGPGGQAFGTYQITPQTWDNTATYYGWDDLVGVRPDQASPADQEQVAVGLLEWQGTSPWSGDCGS